MRAVAGAKATGAVAVTKAEKVGVAPASIVTGSEDANASRHWPVIGSVGQSRTDTGRVAPPKSAVTVSADTPLSVAWEKLHHATDRPATGPGWFPAGAWS